MNQTWTTDSKKMCLVVVFQVMHTALYSFLLAYILRSIWKAYLGPYLKPVHPTPPFFSLPKNSISNEGQSSIVHLNHSLEYFTRALNGSLIFPLIERGHVHCSYLVLVVIAVLPRTVSIVRPKEPLTVGGNNGGQASTSILECRSVGSRPPATITWWKKGKFMGKAPEQVGPITNYIVTRSWGMGLNLHGNQYPTDEKVFFGFSKL